MERFLANSQAHNSNSPNTTAQRSYFRYFATLAAILQVNGFPSKCNLRKLSSSEPWSLRRKHQRINQGGAEMESFLESSATNKAIQLKLGKDSKNKVHTFGTWRVSAGNLRKAHQNSNSPTSQRFRKCKSTRNEKPLSETSSDVFLDSGSRTFSISNCVFGATFRSIRVLW